MIVYLIDEAEACFEVNYDHAVRIARPECEIQEISFHRKADPISGQPNFDNAKAGVRLSSGGIMSVETAIDDLTKVMKSIRDEIKRTNDVNEAERAEWDGYLDIDDDDCGNG